MTSAIGIGWKAKFAETAPSALQRFILDHSLGTLVTHLPNAAPDLQATHIPFIFDAPSAAATDQDPNVLGTLRGHMALKNPHAIALMDSTHTLDQKVMVLFTSPTESYVTPSFYTSTKPSTGIVVPTWFFGAVQVYGTLTLHTSPTFLQMKVEDRTRHGEECLMGFPAEQAWKVSDAPEVFRGMLMEAIVGVEIKIMRMEGKGNFGQEIKAADQMGCIRGFGAMGTECGKGIARQIEASMRKDRSRVSVLEKEMGLLRGKKVKGRFGWYFTAAEGGGETQRRTWFMCVAIAVFSFFLGLLVAHLLG